MYICEVILVRGDCFLEEVRPRQHDRRTKLNICKYVGKFYKKKKQKRVKKSCGCKPCCRWDDPKEEMSEKKDLSNVVREEIG